MAPDRPNPRLGHSMSAPLILRRSCGPITDEAPVCTAPIAVSHSTSALRIAREAARIDLMVLVAVWVICAWPPVVENAGSLPVVGIHTSPEVAVPHPLETAGRLNVSVIGVWVRSRSR